MKKFSFSLQKLLNYKVQLFEIEMTVLGEMNALLYQMQQMLEDTKASFRLGADQINTKTREGTSAQEIIMHKIYLKSLSDDIENKKIQIQFQKLAIEKQTDKVREAKIEISIIDKLKEKKYEEYTAMETKAQELFIDEFVSNAKATEQHTAQLFNTLNLKYTKQFKVIYFTDFCPSFIATNPFQREHLLMAEIILHRLFTAKMLLT